MVKSTEAQQVEGTGSGTWETLSHLQLFTSTSSANKVWTLNWSEIFEQGVALFCWGRHRRNNGAQFVGSPAAIDEVEFERVSRIHSPSPLENTQNRSRPRRPPHRPRHAPAWKRFRPRPCMYHLVHTPIQFSWKSCLGISVFFFLTCCCYCHSECNKNKKQKILAWSILLLQFYFLVSIWHDNVLVCQ